VLVVARSEVVGTNGCSSETIAPTVVTMALIACNTLSLFGSTSEPSNGGGNAAK